LKVCLFGNEEVNLLEEMRGNPPPSSLPSLDSLILYPGGRSDEEISEVISFGVKQKKKALGGHDTPASIAASKNRPMILIGG
jgi:hypothetical protein